MDRLRLRAQLSDSELAPLRQAVLAVIASLELVEVDATALDRAAQPMPTYLERLTQFIWLAPCSGATVLAKN